MDLRLLIFSPIIISILFLLPIFSGKHILVRRIAKLFAGLHFIYSLFFIIFYNIDAISNFDTEITFFGEKWLGSLGVSLIFGLDGLSLLLVLLTSFLVLISCIASKGSIKSKHSLYYALIFILETSVLGTFCAKDIFVFFLFWELELIPMYFLISLWGHDFAKKSAMKFLLYTFIGSLFMLCGFLMLYNFNYISTSELSAAIDNLNFDYESAPIYLQVVASIFILLGFAVKLPIIPLHNWLPAAHVDAPTPVSMLLAGILLKMGAYGIIRFNMQLLPDAFIIIVPYLVFFAFINIVFAAFVAFVQTDIKRIVAYSSISSMGLVLLGLCSLNAVGITGAVLLMLAHGIISSGLFFSVGVIYNRTGTRNINQLGGLVLVMPRLALFTFILCLASMGVPLLISFPAEFMIFFGAFISAVYSNYYIQVVALVSIIVLVLSLIYSLRLLHKTFYGELSERWLKVGDVVTHEFIILSVISSVTVIFGIVPMSVIIYIIPAIRNITDAFGG